MTIDWDIEPVTEPQVPRRPEPRTGRRRTRLNLASRSRVIVGGAVALAVAVTLGGVVAFGSSDPAPAKSAGPAAGSTIGHDDPFAVRRAQNLDNVWSHDFFSDPIEILVEGDDAFVVTPNAVTALGTEEGHQRWRVDVKDAAPFVAADRATVVVATTDGFEALDRRTGASRWRVGVDDPRDQGSTVGLVRTGAGAVAVAATAQGGVVGLDATTGEPRWSVDVDGSPRGRWAVDDASASAALETSDGENVTLRVFDAASGKVRWSVGLGRDTGIPVFTDGLLIVGSGRSDDGTIRGYAATDGRLRWETPATNSFEATMAPVVSGRSVIVVDKLGRLFSLAAATGAVKWSTAVPGPVLADSPAVAGGLIVVHDAFAEIHTVDQSTGRLIASRASVGVPLGLGGAPNRIVYAQTRVRYGQVMAYAPQVLASQVRAGQVQARR